MQGKYSLWTKVLSCLLAGLAISSYLIPAGEMGEDWIPLLSGFVDLSVIGGNLWIRGILGAVSNILIVVSLLVINKKSVNNVFNPRLSASFFLLILLLHPGAVYFCGLHPAVLLFVWGQYCFIIDQKFTSMFLLSCSALFYAPLMWVLPLVWAISIMGAADIPRVALKSLGGLVLPMVYLLCFRYMAFGDAGVFIQEYLAHAAAYSSPFHSFRFTSLFLLACLCAVSVHSISYMFSRLYKNSIITEHILKMELMCFVLAVMLLVLFWGNGSMPLNMLAALPAALLFSHYFTGNINAAPARVELILLCCAAAISRLSYFI